ncbi:ubiquitin carboxyl-terminal hydrolase 19-like isoform X2 [Macadamia integrifolia]|uniref:ubiquitin carboxyl-terminal hydrolase 19-like isoform X2 n=1 Tax=Macadamia integrifolia TaxID=60698 RepID=UPI001C531518|nr:ubiquitin carboxyl-terminal hydrolase 19-like isoform X2 [Macadamia integrifolia]
MHVAGLSLDPYWFLQFVFTAFLVALGLLHLVKNTASKYFVVDANFDEGEGNRRTGRDEMLAVAGDGDGCAVCGNSTNKKCSRCKIVRYCSQACQAEHWKSIHKSECKVVKSSGSISLIPSVSDARRRAVFVDKSPSDPGHGNCMVQRSKKILFPYDEFVKLFNWDKPGFPPCGLINCGNSCFANVVLQCLSFTRPLVAFLLEKSHRRECRRNDWCFLCELQTHIERASHNSHPFSPINILSRLPNIGGNLGNGKQEDAHEFMRFAIDTMQSVCLDEFGGERALHPSSQETTLIQHIFGGHLQSQVICTKCNKISNRYENMMDLTVEIQGDATSLEDCLDQFTVKEPLDGENMYKCDGCNAYVKAWKRLTVRQAPNILTIALKRFQSGRFGKLNKKVTFPETLDLGPYMSESVDGTNLYRLYAVVVHVDMLNASFFGHYICYTKDFQGNWYRIDDCKVVTVELEEVLAQGAYMLLYSRNCVRPPCANSLESSGKEGQVVAEAQESGPCSRAPVESLNVVDCVNPVITPLCVSSDVSHMNESIPEEELSLQVGEDSKSTSGGPQDMRLYDPGCSSSGSKDIECRSNEDSHDVVVSVELEHKEVPDLPSSSDSISVMVQSKECDSSSSYSVYESSFEDGSGATNNYANDLYLESSAKNYLSSLNIDHEMAETSLEVCTAASSSVREKSDGANHAGSETSPSLSLEPVVIVKPQKCSPVAQTADGEVSRLAGMKSPCKGNSKPLFSSGFLNKSTRSRSLKRQVKIDVEHTACSSGKDDRNCNGVEKPAFPGQSIDEVCEHKEFSLNGGRALTTCSVRTQSENCVEDDDDKLTREAHGVFDPRNENECNGGAVSVHSDKNHRNNHNCDNGHEKVSENGSGQLVKHWLPVQRLESNSCSEEKLKSLPSSGFLGSHRREKILGPDGETQKPPVEVDAPSMVDVKCNGIAEHALDHQNISEANGHGQLASDSNGTSTSCFIANHIVNKNKMVNKEISEVRYPQNNCSRDSVLSDENGEGIYNIGSGQVTFCGTSSSQLLDCMTPFLSTSCNNMPLGKNYSNKNEESRELNETVHHHEVETDCQRLSDGRPPPKKQPLNMTYISPKEPWSVQQQHLEQSCDCRGYFNATLADEDGQDFKRQRRVN